MKTQITLHYRKSITLDQSDNSSKNHRSATVLLTDMLQLGFIPSKELFKNLLTVDTDSLVDLRESMVPTLQSIKGGDVQYKPMYPNFPKQVAEASEVELYINAIAHYLTLGTWTPSFFKELREFKLENVKPIEIGLINEEEFKDIFSKLVQSNDSLSDFDKKTIKWFMNNESVSIPKQIPYKETMCYVAGILLEQGKDISGILKTTTDVLRVATYLSDGDISLSSNTKFVSLSRAKRKTLTMVLDRIIKFNRLTALEDIQRHSNKWIKLFHSLHVGDFSDDVYSVSSYVRSNKKVPTFTSKVQNLLNDGEIIKAALLLASRPGEFVRKLSVLLDNAFSVRDLDIIMSLFNEAIDRIPTRTLLQLLGYLKFRQESQSKRVIFPKGNMQKFFVLEKEVPSLDSKIITDLSYIIKEDLMRRFSKQERLGNVWIDPSLKKCPIPTQQRSASKGLYQVARGTHIPFNKDKGTLRFFIYWIGQDIDLSATFHDANFVNMGHVSYTNLRDEEFESYHSGDIVHAPTGACEFIDVDIENALANGVRYIAMNVLVYDGSSFANHDKVYAGWMLRDHPDSNEIFEPKTVEQKVDLSSNSKYCSPVIFDLVNNEAIWTDLTIGTSRGCNNVESRASAIQDVLTSVVSMPNKVSLYELFQLHATSRGVEVDNREEADNVFAFDGDITPYNIDIINSEYVI